MPGKKWTESETQYLKDNYESGSTSEISHKLSRPLHAIHMKANSLGLKRNKDAIFLEQSRARTKCSNHDYFKTWSPNMAYVLGMWFADGTVSGNSNVISLSLHKRDKDIIESIKNELKFNGKLIKDKNNYKMSIGSSSLHDDLISLGCIPNKSYICSMPIGIPKELVSHFIRGNFDGDGCVTTIRSPGRTYMMVNFLGTESFVSWLRDNIPFCHSSITHRAGPCWQISFFNSEAEKLIDWMYVDANLYMQRKVDHIQGIKNEIDGQSNHGTFYSEEDEEYIRKYAETKTVEELAQSLNRNTKSIYNKASKLKVSVHKANARKANAFSEEEIEFIEANAGKMSSYKIGNSLGRPASSIRSYIQRHGICNNSNRWTEEEIQFLKDNHLAMNKDELSMALSRTNSGIEHKVARLGLKKEGEAS